MFSSKSRKKSTAGNSAVHVTGAASVLFNEQYALRQACAVMSRRTAPIYSSSSSIRWMEGSDRRCAEQVRTIFDALEMARFDGVRRAVRDNSAVLEASSAHRSTFVVTGTAHHERTTPVDYALELCRRWQSMQEHCERTGVLEGAPGFLTIRQRLLSMSSIIEWLIEQPGAPLPSTHALHTVISCQFSSVAEILLKRDASFAKHKDARGKTPLHIACRMAVRISSPELLRYIRMLRDADAHVNATDNEGLTPLHDLVLSFTSSRRRYGLARTRMIHSPLSTMQNVAEYLIAEGANLYAHDNDGVSPLELALNEGLDYVVLVKSAERVFMCVCRNRTYRVNREDDEHIWTRMGYFESLPAEVIFRILSHLSPREAVTGIACTCKALHALATSDTVWRHLSTASGMLLAREAVRKLCSDPSRVHRIR